MQFPFTSMPTPQPGRPGESLENAAAQRRNRIYWLLLLMLCASLLLVTFGPALSLPFMADDFFQFPFVDRHTLAELWQTAEGLYYYRPLAFSFWKVAAAITGYHSPLLLHASNLLIHLSNALLVGWLADQLWAAVPGGAPATPNWARRFIGASLYLVFPFSFEAVPWVAALMHPLMTALVLLSVAGYLQLRDKGSLLWGVASLICAFLAPFAHENGALALPLLAAVEVTRPAGDRSSPRERLTLLSYWIIPLFLWYLIWRLEPRTVGTGGLSLNSLATMLRNSIYVLQAAAYPVTWFGVPIVRRLPLAELPAIALLSTAGLAVLAWIQWRGGADRRSLLPWLWFLIASIPAVAFLSFSYLQAAPRVLMLASVGIVWLWVDAIVLLPELLKRLTNSVTLPKVVSAGLVLVMLGQSVLYIRQQMRTYEAGGDLIWDIVHKTVAANESGHIAVFANLPTWLALPRTYFALGEEGAMLMPTADKMDTLVTVHSRSPAQILAIEHPETRQEMPYYHGIVAQEPDWSQLATVGAQLFATRYVNKTLFAQPAGSMESAAGAEGAQPLALFEECLILHNVDTHFGKGILQIELVWWQTCEIPAEFTVFVHLLDEKGALVAQADGDPLLGILPFSRWPENALVSDKRWVALESPPAVILVGLYDRYSGERLPAYAADGARLIDDALHIAVD